MNFYRVLLACLLSSAATHANSTEVEVSAGQFDRPAGTILSAEVEGIPEGARAVLLEPDGGIGQVVPGNPPRIFWILAKPLRAGEHRRLTVSPVKAQGVMNCIESDGAIELQRAGKGVLRFVKTPTGEAKSHEPFYTRTGYIHPLWTPAGREITGDYPLDHVHQHALFFAWTKTEFEGRKCEFWNQKLELGRVNYQETNETTSGVAFAGFSASNLYEDLKAPGGPKPVIRETWEVRAWYRPDENDYQIIDLDLEQRCAGDSPLTIEKYHYGGMAMRGNSEWLGADKNAVPPAGFLTNQGKTREDGNHTSPDWVSMHGPLESGSANVTIFAHPGNFRHPQPVRLHPAKPYFVFAPMVDEPFQISPQKPYRAKFRIIVQDREPDPDQLDAIWQNYANPAEVTTPGK